jgi:hypothetical protein
MAVQWMDNFQQYGTDATLMLNGAYAQINDGQNVSIAVDPDATAGGTTVLKFSSGGNSQEVRKVLTTSATTVGIMQRLWMSTMPTDSRVLPHLTVLKDVSNNCIGCINVETDGRVSYSRGGINAALGGTVVVTSSSPAVVANAWQHVEVKVVIHASAGSVEVRVDGTTVLLSTGINTGNATCTQVSTSNSGYPYGVAPTFYIKDYAIWDTTGALNNTFLGSCFVYSLRPDSDVSGTWTITGGAGSAFASINETNPDDDTKYISSPFPAATADVCTLTDLPSDATSVKALMAFVRSRKSDGGDGNLQISLISGASTGNGSDRPITTAYTYWSDIFETDPATSAQWAVAAVNAAKIKFNRTL